MSSANTKVVKYLIIGAGLAGLSSAFHFKKDYLLVEANNNSGGTADSMFYNGFKLDNAVHILYFKNNWTKDFISNELNIRLDEIKRDCRIWLDGKLIPFPLQFNLHALPFAKRLNALLSVLKNSANIFSRNTTTYLYDWSINNYGEILTNLFFKPYNEKLWGIDSKELTIDWMGDYVPKPELKNIIQGFYSSKKSYGRNFIFYYPAQGGIHTVSQQIEKKIDNVLYNCRLTDLDTIEKVARFSTGMEIKYDYLVSTIPLIELLNSLTTESKQNFNGLNKLRSNSLTLAHLLIPEPNICSGLHWLYVPAPSIPFYRITFPHNICKANCPDGRSALTLEFGGEVPNKSEMEINIINHLVNMGLISKPSNNFKILWKQLKYGYVTYDINISNARNEIMLLLNKLNIFSIGRYGNWEYSNMESALLQGKRIAERLTS